MIPIFLDRAYNEAFDLLVEARDYFAYREPQERHVLRIEQRLQLNCEALRLTSRLTQIMAWLLVQKAVHAGEMSAIEAAADEHRLAGQYVCLVQSDPDTLPLPAHLQSLLDRSYLLYQRIGRLDAMTAARVH